MSAMADLDIEVRQTIEKIRHTQSALLNWTDENEDLCGVDDATWFDTIAEFDERLASLGIHLAGLVEQLIGEV